MTSYDNGLRGRIGNPRNCSTGVQHSTSQYFDGTPDARVLGRPGIPLEVTSGIHRKSLLHLEEGHFSRSGVQVGALVWLGCVTLLEHKGRDQPHDRGFALEAAHGRRSWSLQFLARVLRESQRPPTGASTMCTSVSWPRATASSPRCNAGRTSSGRSTFSPVPPYARASMT